MSLLIQYSKNVNVLTTSFSYMKFKDINDYDAI